MRYGKVIDFFPGRGFGFIRPDFGPDVYFHITALGACRQPPQILPGQPVKFEFVPGTEPKSKRQMALEAAESPKKKKPVRPQAQLVELIDRIPGGSLDDKPLRTHAAPHPKARHRKPTWRRPEDDAPEDGPAPSGPTPSGPTPSGPTPSGPAPDSP